MKYLHALLARDRENLQENPRALLLLTCKLAEHMLQTIILNTLPQSPRTGTGKSTKIIEKRFVTNNPFGKFLRLGNSAWDFFLGFDFCPHSIIPVTRNPEYPPWELCYGTFFN